MEKADAKITINGEEYTGKLFDAEVKNPRKVKRYMKLLTPCTIVDYDGAARDYEAGEVREIEIGTGNKRSSS